MDLFQNINKYSKTNLGLDSPTTRSLIFLLIIAVVFSLSSPAKEVVLEDEGKEPFFPGLDPGVDT